MTTVRKSNARKIIERDDWTCQVCGHKPPENSDEPMFTTLVGSDETHPDHFETRCRKCHVDYVSDDPEPEFAPKTESGAEDEHGESQPPPDEAPEQSLSDKIFRNFIALLFYSQFLPLGVGLPISGLTVINPLRLVGMSTWPVEFYPEQDTITVEQYLYDVVYEAPMIFITGFGILGVGTLITIWIEPKNGVVTRLTKYLIKQIRKVIRFAIKQLRN